MQKANEHGVCEAETAVELARRGRAYASVELCQCEDGLYRYALDMMSSYSGFCGPISIKATGFTSEMPPRKQGSRDAGDAATFPESLAERTAERS